MLEAQRVNEESARKSFRIGIVEDDPPLLSFYSALVTVSDDMVLSFAERKLADARAQLTKGIPDLCMVDLGLPDGSGVELVRELKAMRADCKVLVMTVLGDRKTVMTALKAGADGYILKSLNQADIQMHMRQTLNGFTPISPQVATYLIEMLQSKSVPGSESTQSLTPREVEVLSVCGRGLTYDETAQVLGITANTVRDFVKKIYAKLDVHSRAEALFEASSLGLLRDGSPERA